MENNGIVKTSPPALQPVSAAIEHALLRNDLSKLTQEQKLDYLKAVCGSLGLNPLTNPFSYTVFDGKERLYATRDCTDQLRNIHSVSITIVDRQMLNDIYIVTARASLPSGRTDESTGAVCLQGLKGKMLANAYMIAETKAKRRVALSICGLGFLDETEVETMQELKPVEDRPARIESRRATMKAPAKGEAVETNTPAPPVAETAAETAVAEATLEAAKSYRFTTPEIQIRKRDLFGEPMLSYSIELLEWMFTHEKFYSRLNASDQAFLKFVTENWAELTAPPKEAEGFKPLSFEEDEIPNFEVKK